MDQARNDASSASASNRNRNSATTTTIARRLDEAATKAYELVEEYAEVQDPHSDSKDNPWRDPEAIFDKLNKSRQELMEAWRDLKEETSSNSNTVEEIEEVGVEGEDANPQKSKVAPEEFRALYMDMITDAFADVLENMRETTNQETMDVDVLVDCLQSGIELLSSLERDGGFLQAFLGEEDDDEAEAEAEDSSKATPQHELRRRELGFDVSVSTS